MRIKRTLAILLSAVLTLSLCLTALPKTAHAADGDVFIGSYQVAGSGIISVQYLKAGSNPGDLAIGDSSNYAIKYDPDVTPAKITVRQSIAVPAAYHSLSSNTSSCIYTEHVPLEICIESGNTLTLNNPSNLTSPSTDYDYCIRLVSQETELTISGGGTLIATVTGGAAKMKAFCIFAGSVTVSGNTTVRATSGAAKEENCGVATIRKLTVGAGASLTATGGNVIGNTGQECTSYGVYCANNMTVNGTLIGSGGVVTLGAGNPYQATSAGVYAGGTLTVDGGAVTGTGGAATSPRNDAINYGVYAGGTLTADDGTVTGMGGAATSQDDAAISYGVYIGNAGSVTGNNGRMIGNAGASTGSMNDASAQSVGVHCVGSLTVGSASAAQTAALTGTGGSADATTALASGGATSIGVRTLATITVHAGAALTGTGGSASAATNASKASVGVNASSNAGGQSITVGGTLVGTGGTGLTGGISYGVTTGSGTIGLYGGGSMTATANGTGTSASFGVAADGIGMSNDSHLIAQVKAEPDYFHSAKTLRDSANRNALTADRTAVWRESKSGAFQSIRSYIANGNAKDRESRQYLEVKSGGDGLKAEPVSLDFDTSTIGGALPGAISVTITNTSGRALTLAQPAPANYTVTLPQTTLAAGMSMDITIQPKSATMHTETDYDATITLSESAATNPAKVEIPVKFTVRAAAVVTMEANPWDNITNGTAVTLTATASGGSGTYALYEWSSRTSGTATPTTWTTTTNTDTVRPTETTFYKVRVKDSNNVWSDFSDEKRVTVINVGALTIDMLPRKAYPIGMCGGDYNVRGGAGTVQGALRAANLRPYPDGLTVLDANGTNYPPSASEYGVYDSTFITLDESYLNRLPAGTYTLTAHIVDGIYDGQTPSVTFQVTAPAAPADVPKTGDNTPLALLCALMLTAGAGLAARAAVRRRRNGEDSSLRSE